MEKKLVKKCNGKMCGGGTCGTCRYYDDNGAREFWHCILNRDYNSPSDTCSYSDDGWEPR